LTDFGEALKFNHRYLPALSNKAHVLGEVMHRTQDAVLVLDQILDLYPDHVPSRVSRGVLRARLGQHDKAVEDATEALRRRNNAVTQYQAAGIFALAGPDRPEDLRKALDLLRQALRDGFGHDWIERDPDLDRIRNTTEFRRLAAAAATLQTKSSARQ